MSKAVTAHRSNHMDLTAKLTAKTIDNHKQ